MSTRIRFIGALVAALLCGPALADGILNSNAGSLSPLSSGGSPGNVVVVGAGATQVQDGANVPFIQFPINSVQYGTLFGWGNTATDFYLTNVRTQPGGYGNAPVMGGFSTNTGQSAYFPRDQVGSTTLVQDTEVNSLQASVSSFTATTVVLASPVSCATLHAKTTNAAGATVAGSLISTNDTPKFSGEVTGTGCSSPAGTTSTLTVSAWFRVVGSSINTATITAAAGTSGCTNGATVTLGNPNAPNGGLYDWQGTLTATVAGGVITGLSVAYAGSYSQTSLPANPVNLIGSGCASTPTATITWNNTAANTAAGQVPSGTLVQINPVTQLYAANYVCNLQGTAQVRRCQGIEIDIDNNTGFDETAPAISGLMTGLRIANLGNNAIATQLAITGPSEYGIIVGNGGAATGTLGQIYLYPAAAPATIVSSVGTLDFYTGNTIPGANNGQFEIGFTASAANRYQVIGATTANGPTLQPVGSDAAISSVYVTKSTGIHIFRPGTDSTAALIVQHAGGGNRVLQADTTNDILYAPFKFQVGSNTALTLVAGEIGLAKIAASGSAPGAAGGKFELVCGTGAGSAKLVAYAGTSTTPVTIVDNIGSGVTGC